MHPASKTSSGGHGAPSEGLQRAAEHSLYPPMRRRKPPLRRSSERTRCSRTAPCLGAASCPPMPCHAMQWHAVQCCAVPCNAATQGSAASFHAKMSFAQTSSHPFTTAVLCALCTRALVDPPLCPTPGKSSSFSKAPGRNLLGTLRSSCTLHDRQVVPFPWTSIPHPPRVEQSHRLPCNTSRIIRINDNM